MPRLWAGGWDSSETRCLPTSRGGTSGAYLVPTACLPWDPSGTRRASESGKRKGIGCVVSRSDNSRYEIWGEGWPHAEAMFWRGWVSLRLAESFGIVPAIVLGPLLLMRPTI